jgi:hypothetical protein
MPLGSFTFTPSIRTKVCVVSAPRSDMPATEPVLPVRLNRTPGTVASRSTTSTDWRFSIVAASMIVIA